jgi:hypothetical protein
MSFLLTPIPSLLQVCRPEWTGGIGMGKRGETASRVARTRQNACTGLLGRFSVAHHREATYFILTVYYVLGLIIQWIAEVLG